MHHLKEFLYLAAFRLDVPFEPGSHLTDLWQPKMDWRIRSKDNGRGGFWYQPGVRLVSLISISLVNDSSLVTDWSTEVCVGYSQYVLGSGFRNLFFHSLGMCWCIFTEIFVTTGTTFNLYWNRPSRMLIHDHYKLCYWPRLQARMFDISSNLRLVSGSRLER